MEGQIIVCSDHYLDEHLSVKNCFGDEDESNNQLKNFDQNVSRIHTTSEESLEFCSNSVSRYINDQKVAIGNCEEQSYPIIMTSPKRKVSREENVCCNHNCLNNGELNNIPLKEVFMENNDGPTTDFIGIQDQNISDGTDSENTKRESTSYTNKSRVHCFGKGAKGCNSAEDDSMKSSVEKREMVYCNSGLEIIDNNSEKEVRMDQESDKLFEQRSKVDLDLRIDVKICGGKSGGEEFSGPRSFQDDITPCLLPTVDVFVMETPQEESELSQQLKNENDVEIIDLSNLSVSEDQYCDKMADTEDYDFCYDLRRCNTKDVAVNTHSYLPSADNKPEDKPINVSTHHLEYDYSSESQGASEMHPAQSNVDLQLDSARVQNSRSETVGNNSLERDNESSALNPEELRCYTGNSLIVETDDNLLMSITKEDLKSVVSSQIEINAPTRRVEMPADNESLKSFGRNDEGVKYMTDGNRSIVADNLVKIKEEDYLNSSFSMVKADNRRQSAESTKIAPLTGNDFNDKASTLNFGKEDDGLSSTDLLQESAADFGKSVNSTLMKSRIDRLPKEDLNATKDGRHTLSRATTGRKEVSEFNTNLQDSMNLDRTELPSKRDDQSILIASRPSTGPRRKSSYDGKVSSRPATGDVIKKSKPSVQSTPSVLDGQDKITHQDDSLSSIYTDLKETSSRPRTANDDTSSIANTIKDDDVSRLNSGQSTGVKRPSTVLKVPKSTTDRKQVASVGHSNDVDVVLQTDGPDIEAGDDVKLIEESRSEDRVVTSRKEYLSVSRNIQKNDVVEEKVKQKRRSEFAKRSKALGSIQGTRYLASVRSNNKIAKSNDFLDNRDAKPRKRKGRKKDISLKKGSSNRSSPGSKSPCTPTSKTSSKLSSPQLDSQGNETKKIPPIKAPVGLAPKPNTKGAKSKIGSMNNIKYKPGGGDIKLDSKRLDFNEKAKSKVGSTDNIKYKPGGGDKKLSTQKLEWKVQSKIGSLENATYKPGGGQKKIIESQKVDFKASSKIGSLENTSYKPGGGQKKIESQKLEFKEKASSKVGSLENASHKPGGGNKKIDSQQLEFKEKAAPKIGSSDNIEHVPGGGGGGGGGGATNVKSPTPVPVSASSHGSTDDVSDDDGSQIRAAASSSGNSKSNSNAPKLPQIDPNSPPPDSEVAGTHNN